MAVESELTLIAYTGNGSTSTPYPVTFDFLDPAHVKVGLRDGEGNITDLDEDEYTVTASPAQVTTNPAIAADQTLVVYRQVPITQPAVFPLAGSLNPAQIEQAFDRLTMIQQQLARAMDGNGVYASGEGDGALRDTYFWANDAERGTIKPRRRGQLGIQLDTEAIYRSDSASVGDWVLAAVGATGPTGPTGGVGPAGADGPPLNFRGAYNSGTNYVAGECVTRLGSAYIALRSTVGDAPESSPSDWALFCEKGDTGDTGATGPGFTAATISVTTATGLSPSGTVTATGSTLHFALKVVRGPAGTNGTNGTNGGVGPTGARGPTGNPGVTSATVDSTTTGTAEVIVALNAGNLAFDFIIPRGPTGPTGAASTVPGPTGPAGTNGTNGMDGGTGPTGPTGPKGSFVSVDSGIYELACAEATRPWFFHIRKTDEEIPKPFLETICGDVLRFPSHDGRHELCFGVRREFPEWFMPRSTQEQMRHSVAFWNQEYLPKDERGQA